MDNDRLFTIGEICSICDMKASKLRYYDSIGIIRPYRIDENNGYRYYSKQTLEQLPVLVYLQRQGFSLKDTEELLKGLSMVAAKEIFQKKIEELDHESFDIDLKRNCIRSWMDLIDEAESVLAMKRLPINLKYIPEMETTRFSASSFEGRTFDNLLINTSVPKELKDEEAHTIGALYLYYPDGNRENWDDLRIYIRNQVHLQKSEIIGGYSAVSCYHRGDYDTIGDTVDRMKKWASKHGFTLRGDLMERSVIDLWTVKDRSQWVMELYLPVVDE